METRRWYMLNKMGMATLCTDKEGAEQEAADAQMAWPHMGPHRAVQLVEAADVEALRAGYAAARLEIESLRARSVAHAGEYPALPEIKDMHNGPQQLNLSDRAMWVLGWNECRDAARDADRAMRAAQQESFDHGPQATSIEEAARDVGKWLNERPNRPLDLRHVAMLCAQPAPQQEAQEPVAVPRFNCWSTNEGDSWFDHPADSQAIYDCLGNNAKVGDEYELTAGWESVTARYRITEVVGDDEEYEVECISHPQENTAPPPSTTAQGYALDALRAALAALNEAATSLETIARLAGRTTHGTPPIETHMETPAEIRSYAAARALVARAAQEGN